MNHNFLQAMIDASQQQGEDDTPSRPTLLAQQIGLRERWDRYNTRPDFKPGDLVREKPGLGCIKAKFKPDTAMMLWRILDMNDPHDAEIIKDAIRQFRVNRVNCLVAFLDDNGGETIFIPHELAQLEKADEL